MWIVLPFFMACDTSINKRFCCCLIAVPLVIWLEKFDDLFCLMWPELKIVGKAAIQVQRNNFVAQKICLHFPCLYINLALSLDFNLSLLFFLSQKVPFAFRQQQSAILQSLRSVTQFWYKFDQSWRVDSAAVTLAVTTTVTPTTGVHRKKNTRKTGKPNGETTPKCLYIFARCFEFIFPGWFFYFKILL